MEEETRVGRGHRPSRVAVGLGILVALVTGVGDARGQESVAASVIMEVPTTGAQRLGPVGPVASPAVDEAPIVPVAIRIDKAGVDAPIETRDIVDGVMEDPSGPWVVAWYDELAAPGDGSNAVLSGHVDYWDTGPAVFWNLKDLVEGDKIVVTGQDGEALEYAVAWSRLYDVATELTPEVIQEEVTGPTARDSLTLITCGGPFNPETGQYLQRLIVRAVRVA